MFPTVTEVLAASNIRAMREAARTSEKLVNFYQTTRRYNPEESHLLPDYTALQRRRQPATFHTRRRENLKSYL
jgi:hypothetical protein